MASWTQLQLNWTELLSCFHVSIHNHLSQCVHPTQHWLVDFYISIYFVPFGTFYHFLSTFVNFVNFCFPCQSSSTSSSTSSTYLFAHAEYGKGLLICKFGCGKAAKAGIAAVRMCLGCRNQCEQGQCAVCSLQRAVCSRNECEQAKLSHKAGWSTNQTLVNTSRPNPVVHQNTTSTMGCKVQDIRHSLLTSIELNCAGGFSFPPDTWSGWSQFPAIHLLQVPSSSTPKALPWT